MFGFAVSSQAQGLTQPQLSPHAEVSQVVGVTEISISYFRPSVKGRVVWGALVPWGFTNLGFGPAELSPWRAGANENTLFTIQHDIMIEGQALAAGVYGLHMAIAENGTVTVIFSNNSSSWGSFFYEESEDALRVDVPWIDHAFTEQLEYSFTDVKKESAVLSLNWENKSIPVSITVDTDVMVVEAMKAELRSSAGFQYQNYSTAANYLLNNKLDGELALSWAEAALNAPFIGQKTFQTLSLKGKALENLGRDDEAEPIMDEAMTMASSYQIHAYARGLVTAGKADRALVFFKLNAEKYPGQWPTYYGLARGYSAVGDYENALEYLLKAEGNVPEGDTINPPVIAENIVKLKNGEGIN